MALPKRSVTSMNIYLLLELGDQEESHSQSTLLKLGRKLIQIHDNVTGTFD